jgi:small-conductance mechanosensitive channel
MTPTPTPILPRLTADDPIVQFLLSIIQGLVVLVVALVLARLARIWVVRILTRSRVSLNLATLLGNLAQIAIVALGLVFMLPSFGIEWTGLLTLVGAAGLAISLSMQDLLKNVVAGIYILMEQPFRIGDRITVKEVTGTVQGIELRTTILCTDDNLQVVVPNNLVLTEIVTNRSASELSRQILLLSTRRADLTEVSREITTLLRGFEFVASAPAPTTALEELKFGVSRLRIEFWVPTSSRIALTAQVVEALQAHFPDADITVV